MPFAGYGFVSSGQSEMGPCCEAATVSLDVASKFRLEADVVAPQI